MAVLVVKQTFDNFANRRLIDKHMTNKQYLIRFKQMFKCRIFRFERVWGFCPVSNPRNHGADGPALLQLLPSTRWDNDPGGGAHGGGGGGALEGGGGGDGVDDKTDGDSSRGECEWLFGLQCCYSREWVGTGMLSAKTMAMILILTLKVHHGAPQRHKPSDQWYQVYHQVYHWSRWQWIYCHKCLWQVLQLIPSMVHRTHSDDGDSEYGAFDFKSFHQVPVPSTLSSGSLQMRRCYQFDHFCCKIKTKWNPSRSLFFLNLKRSPFKCCRLFCSPYNSWCEIIEIIGKVYRLVPGAARHLRR